MAKVVSSKFGDRMLFHLPPVDFSAITTPNVATIAPRYRSMQQYYRSKRNRHGGGRSSWLNPVDHIPKQNVYRKSDGQHNIKHKWALKRKPEGNRVTNNVRPSEMSEELFSRLFLEASVPTLQNYRPDQYPVIPKVSGAPHYMHYTQTALASLEGFNKQQAGQHRYPGYSYSQQPDIPAQPFLQSVVSAQPFSKTNEKHIYYGSDGQVLPGPLIQNGPEIPEDFAVQGVLLHGRLTAVQVLDYSRGFPKIPDFLSRDLLEKYAHFSKVDVRIVARDGQVYVHATPRFIQQPQPQPQPFVPLQFVPIYIDEDEEFNNNKFLSGYYSKNDKQKTAERQNYKPYRSPIPLQSLYPENVLNRRNYLQRIRPSVSDPIADFRWHKETDQNQSAAVSKVRPVEEL